MGVIDKKRIPFTDQNVESELSYAYLHAITAHAKVACCVSGRHLDNAGVDAHLTSWGHFQMEVIGKK